MQIVSPAQRPHRMQIVSLFWGHVVSEARWLINFCVSLISPFQSLSSHLSCKKTCIQCALDSIMCVRIRYDASRKIVNLSMDFMSDLSNIPHRPRLRPWPFTTKGLSLITCVSVMHRSLKKKQWQVSKRLAVRATPAF